MSEMKNALGVLFGVEGGGSISGESGKRIKDELESIVREINKDGLKVKLDVENADIKALDISLKSLSGILSNLSGATAKTEEHFKHMTAGIGATYAATNALKEGLLKAFNSDTTGGIQQIISSIDDLYDSLEKLNEKEFKVNNFISTDRSVERGEAIQEQAERVQKLANAIKKLQKEGYSKHGIHKGDIGCVMDSNAVQGYVEVDFNGIDENNNHYGDCISVKISDLKVIK